MAKSFLVSDLADELEKLKKRNSKQILYQVGAPSGKATCGYVFAIDESTGNAYYKAADGTWTAFIGGGGGGGYWTATGADIANNNTGLVNIIGSVYTNGIFSADGTGGQVSIGDFNTTVNGTALTLSDSNQSITTQFAGYPHGLFQLQATGGIVTLGTTHGDAGNTNLIINDGTGVISTSFSGYGDGLLQLTNAGFAALGDWNLDSNGNYIAIDDSAGTIQIVSKVELDITNQATGNNLSLHTDGSIDLRGYTSSGNIHIRTDAGIDFLTGSSQLFVVNGSSYTNGLFSIDGGTPGIVSIGDINTHLHGTTFKVDDKNQVITTTFSTYPDHGLLKLQNTAGVAAIGDWASDHNGTAIVITDSSTVVSVRCQSMGIGIINPNPFAILDVTSTSKGFLPPRMTTTQKLALTGVEGMMVYDLTLHKLCVYTGAAWETVTSI